MHPCPRPSVRYQDGGSEMPRYPKGAHHFLQGVVMSGATPSCERFEGLVRTAAVLFEILIMLVQNAWVHACT